MQKNTHDDDDNKKHQKVRDHCHYAERFRGTAHSICNLRYKTHKKITAVFHFIYFSIYIIHYFS